MAQQLHLRWIKKLRAKINNFASHPVSNVEGRENSTGRAKKVIPQEKFDISGIVVIFFRQIYSVYREAFMPHTAFVANRRVYVLQI